MVEVAMRPFHKARPWFFQLNYLVVWVVLIGIQFLTGAGQKPLLMMLMISFALLLQMDSKRSAIGRHTPNELKFFTLWGIWAVLTGFFFIEIKSSWNFANAVKMLIRQVAFLWAAYAIFLRQRQHFYFYWLLVVIALIQVVAAVSGYHLDLSAGAIGGEIVQDALDYSRTRMEGLTGNANSMGVLMLYAIWGCIMLWRKSSNWVSVNLIRKILIIGLITLFSYYTVQSASRKSVLNVIIYLAGWTMWMMPGKLSFKSILIASALGIVLLLVAFFVVHNFMGETVVMKRFTELSDAGGGNAVTGFKEGNVRFIMYVDGIKYWLSYPIAGLGLAQFAAWHFGGVYSHSDYIEPLACTGTVGFILYHAFAFTVLMRLIGLLRRRLPPELSYYLKGMVLCMICNYYFIGFGCPHWMEAIHCMVVVFIGTWAWQVKREFVDHQPLYAT